MDERQTAQTLSGLRQGLGCVQCSHTGYRGRIGIFEFLEIDDALGDALRRDNTAAFHAAVKAIPGFRGLAQSALELAAMGQTSLDEALRIGGEALISDAD